MLYYVPSFNDDVLNEKNQLILPNDKIIQLIEKIYYLDKRYKIEKIISFNNENYEDIIKQITKNYKLELHNHYIVDKVGYFHITFEKELIRDDENLVYDTYCPFAISLIIDGNIDYNKYVMMFHEKIK